MLLHRGTGPKELAHLIEGSAEARGLGHASEPTHGVVALFDATMILLQSMVEIRVGPMQNIHAKLLPDSTWVGIMPIGCHPFWAVAHDVDSLRRSKRLAASLSRVSLLARAASQPNCHPDRWPERDSTISL